MKGREASASRARAVSAPSLPKRASRVPREVFMCKGSSRVGGDVLNQYGAHLSVDEKLGRVGTLEGISENSCRQEAEVSKSADRHVCILVTKTDDGGVLLGRDAHKVWSLPRAQIGFNETAEAAGRRLAQELGLPSSAEELLRQAMWTDVGGAKHGQTDADQTPDDDHQAGMVSSARPTPELLELVEFSALQVLPSPTLCWCLLVPSSAQCRAPRWYCEGEREVRGGLQHLRRQAPSPHLAPTLWQAPDSDTLRSGPCGFEAWAFHPSAELPAKLAKRSRRLVLEWRAAPPHAERGPTGAVGHRWSRVRSVVEHAAAGSRRFGTHVGSAGAVSGAGLRSATVAAGDLAAVVMSAVTVAAEREERLLQRMAPGLASYRRRKMTIIGEAGLRLAEAAEPYKREAGKHLQARREILT